MFHAQRVHRAHHAPNTVQMSTLLSIKTGGCPEDCAYCPQSVRWDTGLDRERLLAVMARVCAKGGKVAFDNNFRPRLWSSPAEARTFHDLAYGLSDIVLITLDDEMALRDETSADRTLADALALAAPEVVVKRGVEPTLVRIAGTPPASVPVETVSQIIDTTAAGDSFAGAYLAMRLTGIDPVAAARAANRLAAMVIQHPGAIVPADAMPTPTALLADPASTIAACA
jgi:2-dehydro-3-deoxygluconokinase